MEKIEYRDAAGNLLNEEQVKALEGKVSFETKYETKTQIIDEEGNDVDSFAGTLAEAEEPSTDFEGEPSGAPPKVNVDGDLKKESKVKVADVKKGQAQPEGEAIAATEHDEL